MLWLGRVGAAPESLKDRLRPCTAYAYDQHNMQTNRKAYTIYRVYSVPIVPSVCEISRLILALWKLDRGHRPNVIGATIRQPQGLALCVFLIKRLRS